MDPSKFLYHPMRLLDHREMEYRFCMQNIQFDNGLFLEFGVYNGSSINILSKLRPNKIFHGFDTFTGLPEDWDLGDKKIKAGHFYLEKMLFYNNPRPFCNLIFLHSIQLNLNKQKHFWGRSLSLANNKKLISCIHFY